MVNYNVVNSIPFFEFFKFSFRFSRNNFLKIWWKFFIVFQKEWNFNDEDYY